MDADLQSRQTNVLGPLQSRVQLSQLILGADHLIDLASQHARAISRDQVYDLVVDLDRENLDVLVVMHGVMVASG